MAKKGNNTVAMAAVITPNVESMFQSLVGNLPAAIYRCAHDADWTMEYISDYIEELTGYPAEDYLIHRTKILPIHEDDTQFVLDEVGKALDAKLPFSVRYRIVHANGSVRWVCDSGCGVFAANGDLEHIDGALFDETEQHKREQSITRQYALLDDIANYGLPKLNSYINNLRKDHCAVPSQSPDSSRADQSIQHNVRQLQNLMDNIVSLSFGGRTTGVDNVDLGLALWEIQRDMQDTLTQRNARIELGELPSIAMNPDQVKRLLSQLIDNATKFNTSSAPIIRINAVGQDDRAEICVSDNGIGFDDYFLESAFELGSRSQNAISYPGDGFGLAVCKLITDTAGQDIRIESDSDVGSRVFFTAPLASG